MKPHKASFAKRRAELLARCAQERDEARANAMGALAPITQVANLRRRMGGFALPLAVLGVVIGLALVRPRRIVPTLTAAAGLWKLAKRLLDAFREMKPAA